MNDQFYAEHGGTTQLVFGRPISIGNLGGEFSVVSGSVWLTRSGDVEDHLLTAGRAVRLRSHAAALAESVYRGCPVVVEWTPCRSRVSRVVRDWRIFRLRSIRMLASHSARLSSRVAAGFESIARRAECAAQRA